MPAYIKDSDAVLDYGFDWSEWLATAEIISASTWTVPTGLTNDGSNNTTTQTTIWLSGGTIGTTYEVVNHITTSAGRKEDRTITIIVQSR